MVHKVAVQREDEYFARQEFERQKKLTEEREAHMKKKERDEIKKLHWMRCPKDGMELVEIEYSGVHVDKCTHCGGVFLDPGELADVIKRSKGDWDVFTKIVSVFR